MDYHKAAKYTCGVLSHLYVACFGNKYLLLHNSIFTLCLIPDIIVY